MSYTSFGDQYTVRVGSLRFGESNPEGRMLRDALQNVEGDAVLNDDFQKGSTRSSMQF